jgi:magnesium transporter
MIHVARWDAQTAQAERGGVELLPVVPSDLAEGSILWIDLESPTPEEEQRVLREFFPVHPLTFDDVTKMRREPEQGPHLPKVEEFPDYLFVIVNPLPAELIAASPAVTQPSERRKARKSRPQLSAILTHTLLITHHYASMPCVMESQQQLTRHVASIRRGPDYLFHLILDSIVDEYAPVVDRIGEKLDHLEAVMFRRPTPRLLARLLNIKREVSYLRKTLILEREVLARLIRGEFHLVDEREIVYYRNVYDHLVRYTELIESAREMVSDLMQTHLAAVSNRLNEVMKVLTMISTTVMPMTLIAGIYGMNFKHMPETEWLMGYPMALLMMLATATASFALFRWKKWI